MIERALGIVGMALMVLFAVAFGFVLYCAVKDAFTTDDWEENE